MSQLVTNNKEGSCAEGSFGEKDVWQGWQTMSQSKGLRSEGSMSFGKLVARNKHEVTQENEKTDQEINVGIPTVQSNPHTL